MGTITPITRGNNDRAPQPLADGFPPGDVGNAQRFVHYYGEDVRYTSEWGWLVWDGARWARDTTGMIRLKAQGLRDKVIQHALNMGTDRKGSDELLTLAKRLGLTSTLNNLLTEVAPMVAVKTLDFDRDPWLLNCPNGTLNLKTGQVYPHSRADMLSKITLAPYEPGANPQLWRLFTWGVFQENVALIQFMQRALGYSITGSTREQSLFIMYGSGSNGKSTLWGTVQRLLGDYAMNTPVKTLLRKERDTGINNDVARMVGARFVTASEPDMGKHLDIATVKDLTGGDPVTARFLNKEFFTFDPVLKIWLSTNHKPIIRDTTNSIWRRIHLIPFNAKFDGNNKNVDLADQLLTEASGILAWLVEGCKAWQLQGLGPPDDVRAASEAYRAEMDPLGPFLGEYCDVGLMSYKVTHKALYIVYCNYCDEAGEKPVNRRVLTDMLEERGYTSDKASGNLKTWYGIR
jgi:putative DNA primase/helicase